MTASGGGRDGEMDSQMVASRAPDVDRLAPLERNLEMVSEAWMAVEEYWRERCFTARAEADHAIRYGNAQRAIVVKLDAEVERLRFQLAVSQGALEGISNALADRIEDMGERAEKAEAEVERLQELVLNGTLGDWPKER